MSISADLVEIAVMTPEGNFERRYIGRENPRHVRVCGNYHDEYTAVNTRLLGYCTGCQNRRDLCLERLETAPLEATFGGRRYFLE